MSGAWTIEQGLKRTLTLVSYQRTMTPPKLQEDRTKHLGRNVYELGLVPIFSPKSPCYDSYL